MVTLTVGLGEGALVVLGVIIDGNVIQIPMNRQQAEMHIAALQRHVNALPAEQPVEHASLN